MSRRTTRAELDQAAAVDLTRILALAGIPFDTGTRTIPSGNAERALKIVGASVVSAPLRKSLVPDNASDVIVVADHITGDARDALGAAGAGWLDRRGHLRLPFEGLDIDVDVTPLPRHTVASGAGSPDIAGQSGLAVAFDALVAAADRHRPSSFGTLASQTGLARQVLHRASTRLRSAYLLREDGTALVPELFWAAAEVWTSSWTPLHRIPESSETELVETGTRAAAGLGAPVVFSESWPVDLYVAEASHITELVARDRPSGPVAARVAVAPARNVFSHATASTTTPAVRHQVAHPVAVALELATDESRGAQIVRDWTPEGIERVW